MLINLNTETKKNEIFSKAENLKKDDKSFFSYIWSRSKSKVKIGLLTSVNGEIKSSSAEMSEEINEYFSTVFTQEDKTSVPSAKQMNNGLEADAIQDAEINCDIVEKKLSTLTLWTPEAGIPAAQYINAITRSWYTGGTVINATGQRTVYRRHSSQSLRIEAGIPDLFSNAYWHRNARVIEIQTRQQLKNNYFHETQQIFMNKFFIWTPSDQRTS